MISDNKICVSIGNVNVDIIKEILDDCTIAEIRLDLLTLNSSEIKDIFHNKRGLIATCRTGENSDSDRYELLSLAIENGAEYIDVDINDDTELKTRIIDLAGRSGVKVIISYHNFIETPDIEELESILNICNQLSPNIIKIACYINNNEDLIRLLSLYNKENRIIVGMGPLGVASRVLATELGAPFTYSYHHLGSPTAIDQIEKSSLKKIFGLIKNNADYK